MALEPGIWIGHSIPMAVGLLGFITTSERLHSVIMGVSLVAMLAPIGVRVHVI